MLQAAGSLFLADNRVLLLRRSDEGDHAGEWALPGGKIEPGESPEQAAARECREELGECPDGERQLWARRQADGVDYTTFVQRIDKPFRPTLNEEHDGFTWAEIGDWPRDLHPGVRVALDKLTMDELGIARAMVAGDLTSPQHYMNVALFLIRITGTGAAWREAHKEVVYRPPELYLTDEFLARCNGLPVILEHPTREALDTKEFTKRVIGTIMLPYLRGNEVWGVAKIYDMGAAEIMAEEQLSTSPAVVFRPLDGNEQVPLDDGNHLLIEGKPSLLDHIAICHNGVWDRADGPTGVETTAVGDSAMSETTMDSGKKDGADPVADPKPDGEKLDKLLAFADSMSGHIAALHAKHDAMCDRMDAMEAKLPKADAMPGAEMEPVGDKARRDASGTYLRKDGSAVPEHVIAAAKDARRARRDASEDDLKESEIEDAEAHLKKAESETAADVRRDAAEARRDAAEARKDAAEVRRIAELHKPRADEDQAKFAEVQFRHDAVAQMMGARAAPPMAGESLLAYRRRMANEFKPHSKQWAGVDLALLPGDALTVAENQIYADAAEAAKRPSNVPVGTFREVARVDPYTGVRTVDFYGPQTIFRSLAARTQAVTRFNTGRAA